MRLPWDHGGRFCLLVPDLAVFIEMKRIPKLEVGMAVAGVKRAGCEDQVCG